MTNPIDDIKSEWWYPTKADSAYFERLRNDYPDKADWPDERLHDYFSYGAKYPTNWDHIGDAYGEYEPLVDAFFAMEEALIEQAAEIDRLTAFIEDLGYQLKEGYPDE
jgi:hypothetical protein